MTVANGREREESQTVGRGIRAKETCMAQRYAGKGMLVGGGLILLAAVLYASAIPGHTWRGAGHRGRGHGEHGVHGEDRFQL